MAAFCSPALAQDSHAAKSLESQDWFYRQRAFPRDAIPPGARRNALRQLDAMSPRAAKRAEAVGPVWTMIGPQPTRTTPEVSAGPPIASGRVTALAVDPRDANIVYLGAAQGGVWKSKDGGQTWQPLTDHEVSLAIGSLAVDPLQANVIYAGTGEENFSGDSYYGEGVLRSTDGGATWQVMGSLFAGPSSASSGGAYIGSIAVHPADSRVVLAAVAGHSGQASGIYRSADRGATWQAVLTGAPGTGLVFDPLHADTVFAALGDMHGSAANGIYVSTDGGLHWAAANGAAPADIPVHRAGRISLTLCAGRPLTLYASIQDLDNNPPLGIFKSTDGGKSWQEFEAPVYCYGDCWYTNVIQVHPANPDVVLVGGDTFYLSKDGGVTWVGIGNGANGNLIHVDLHAMSFSADGSRLYAGSDGGAYSTGHIDTTYPEDIEWSNLNQTLAITQFYPGCSVHPTDPDFMVCGTQDNGAQVYTGRLMWDMLETGDFGWTAIDPARPSVYYFSQAGGIDLEKSTPFGQFDGTMQVTDGIDQGDWTAERCSFTPPYVLDPANPLRIYFGCWRVYQSEDGGGHWSPISEDLGSYTGKKGYIGAIAVSPADSDRAYVGTSNGRVHVTSNAAAGESVTWTDRSLGLPLRAITSLAADRQRPGVAYAGVSGFSGFDDLLGHVFKTTDAGVNWRDISSNLPNTPVNAVLQDLDSPGTIFVGTDIGVFRTTDDGASWSPLGEGLPRVAVMDLRLQPSLRLLRAATHGRSMWQIAVPAAIKAGEQPVIHAAEISPGLSATTGPVPLSVTGAGFVAGSVIRWNGFAQPTEVVNGARLLASVPVAAGAAGRASVQVTTPFGAFSNVFNVDLGLPPTITQVANAASPGSNIPLAPGTVATVFGSGLASAAAVTAVPDGTPWPTTLAQATVEIRNINIHSSFLAPVLSVSPGQINFLMPWTVPLGANDLTVTVGTRVSAPKTVTINAFSPAIYTLANSPQGWIVGTDGSIAGPDGPNSHPAARGAILTLFADGLGPAWNTANPSASAPSTASPTVGTPQVTVGNIPADVTSSVMAQGTFGLDVVTFAVPANAPTGGAVPVVLSIGGIASNTATIAIR